MVVGGGDSAIEAALMLADQNRVTLSYRKDVFQRIKPKNSERIKEAMHKDRVIIKFNSNLVAIDKDYVTLIFHLYLTKHLFGLTMPLS